MRRRRVTLTALATVFLSLFATGLAGPAAAGGPTSVLLVVPGEGRTASLYTGNADYEELAKLIGAYETPSGTSKPPPGADDEGASGTNDASGPGVTVTWLMHDVSVWRVDRVFPNADGGPLISTQTSQNSGDLWANPPIWHQAGNNAKALIELLDRLGVGNPGAGLDPGSDAAVPSPAAVLPGTGSAGTEPGETNPAGTTDSADRTSGPSGWLAGSLGLLLGALLGVGLTLAAVRRRSAARVDGAVENQTGQTPDGETPDGGSGVDVPVGGPRVDVPVGEPGRTPTETLSSHPIR